jgi:hypothetical protein
VTVIVAPPLIPSLVAVIVAVPVAKAVTSPPLVTVATRVLSELQLTARPVSRSLLAARVVAVPSVVSPTTSEDAARDTVTDATGTTVTVSVAVPVTASLAPVITADPAERVVTRPVVETVAIALLSDDHVIMRPVSAAPLALRMVAVA